MSSLVKDKCANLCTLRHKDLKRKTGHFYDIFCLDVPKAFSIVKPTNLQ